MKNPIKSLKSSWNRAKTNHQEKTILGSVLAVGGGSTTASALFLAPFDMGISAGVLGFLTLLTAGGVVGSKPDNHNKLCQTVTTMEYEGESYYVTKQQKIIFDRLEKKKKAFKEDYRLATSKSQRKKIEKKAKQLLDFQADIMASKNVIKVADVEKAPELDFEKLKSPRKPRGN
mgnify:CR=1 FL=1